VTRLSGRAALAFSLLAAPRLLTGQVPPAPAQEPPSFAHEVELVRVDVVVTDKAGRPVTGLTRDDFLLLDEGQPQPIETFEAVDQPVPAATAAAAPRTRVATNEAPPAGSDVSRTVVVVFDDLNLDQASAARAKAAVAMLFDRGVRPGDRVTLVATGGGVWWSTSMPEGRADLLALLKGLAARRVRTDVREAITDFEALRIYVFNDAMVADRVKRRFETYGVTSHAESERERESRQTYQAGIIDPYVMRRATEEYLKCRTRNRATLAAIERTLRPLAATRERKTIVLASDGFVYDTQEDAFGRLREAARRANAVIHFLDARGLQAPSLYSAQFDAPPGDPGSTLAVLADSSLDAEGSEALALDTGGYAIRNTNDLSAGVEKIAVESRSYYLLGFTPNAPRDGRFRRLQVKLKRRDGGVRARRGYYAPGDAAPQLARREPGKDADFQEALDAASFRPDIPLRMTAYVLGEQNPGKARVLVVADVDTAAVSFAEANGQLAGALDVLLVVAERESAEFSRYDQRVDLARKRSAASAAAPPWYTLVREFELKPGGHQAKLVVRDPASSKLGSLAYTFDIPPLGALRVSTPVLTDLLQQTSEGIGPVVMARRSFGAGRPLFCRFDVYGAAREGRGTPPRVSAGHQLRRVSDGTVLERSPLTPIEPTSLGAVARLLQLPLNVPPGAYELTLTVRDEVAGQTVETAEPFVVR
jgi:VWFA-related protein